MNRRKNCVECFNVILEPEMQILQADLWHIAAEIKADYNSRGMLQSTACMSALAVGALDAINSAFLKAINDFFSFLKSQYIPISQSDLSVIKNNVNKRVIAIAKTACEDIAKDGVLAGVTLQQSRLHSVCNGGSSLLSSFIDKEYAKLLLLRKSITIRQTKTAFWFGISSLVLSIMAILISLFGK